MGAYSGVQGGQYEDQARRHQAAAALHNGTSSFLPPVSSSAYTQLQQLYSQAASGKEVKKPAATSNNNYPFSHHAVTTTTATTTAPYGHNNSNYDQIAAALLNRFGGQFNNQFMSEMVKTASVTSASAVSSYQSLAAQSFPPLHSRSSQEEAKPDSVKADKRPPDCRAAGAECRQNY